MRARDRVTARGGDVRAASAEGGALLEGRGLVRAFGAGRHRLVAVDDVSVSLRRGRTLGVVGESGSGKSTLGAMLGGLLEPTAGDVLLDGVPLARMGRRERREAVAQRVQFIFQDPTGSLNPSFTVRRAIEDPLRVLSPELSRAGRARACEEALERVGLPRATLDRRPRELSGGQAQRVAIARALVCAPDVIVCDECTSALDVSVQAQILNLLVELQRTLGTAYVLISHDMAVVAHMADDVLVMRAGRAVEAGPCQRVLDAPTDPYTRRLVEAAEAMRP